MTSEEFKKLTAGLKAAYPSSNFLPDDYSMKLWYRLIGDLDYEIAEAASFKHICNCKFPPSIADIREQCCKVVVTEETSWLDGWSEVQKSIGRFGYMQEKEALKHLESVDPMTASVVERLGWRSLCMSEYPQADRANFRTCYEAIQNRGKEYAKMPEAVRNNLAALTSKFLMQSKVKAQLPAGNA